jgi:hypothetical protein
MKLQCNEEYPGMRLAVVTGSMHRYILRDLLKNEESIDLREYWGLIDRQIAKQKECQLGEKTPTTRPSAN